MIDLQALQTESRYRGIGRSLSEILDQLIDGDKGIRWHFILNANFIKETNEIVSKYKNRKNLFFHTLQVLPENAPFFDRNIPNEKISNYIFLLYMNYIQPDIIFIPNLFEGFIDDAILDLSKTINSKIVILIHDFIPLLNPSSYFDTRPQSYKNFYIERLGFLDKADHIFVISDSVYNEVKKVLPNYKNGLTNISSGVSDKFQIISETKKTDIKTKFGVDRFLLYTGGFDERKNIKILIESYSKYRNEINSEIKLVLSGPINSYDKQTINKWSKNFNLKFEDIVITGYISDEELVALYNSALFFVFPSWHEGFGLPVLEAIRSGTLVLAANSTSLPEVVGTPETLFDPHNSEQIKNLMIKFTNETIEKLELKKRQYQHSLKFSWSKTAQSIIEQLKNLFPQNDNKEKIKWQKIIHDLDEIDRIYLKLIKGVIPDTSNVNFKIFLANILSNNRNLAQSLLRKIHFFDMEKVLIEGPYDTNYSLAIVNRSLSLGLLDKFNNLKINSSDGLGNYKASSRIFSEYPQLKSLQLIEKDDFFCGDIHSRNMYPPRCDSMDSLINQYHCYAWEELGFPIEYVKEFNRNLQLITVTSQHVKNLLINNGVNLPIYVTGNGIDHFRKYEPQSVEFSRGHYNFLHISSCFPRKGIDILLRAYFEEFNESDSVTLTIKTFENPHNEVKDIINNLKIETKKDLVINLIFEDLNPSQLNYLYVNCDCFVGPSRAEGFGLPFAEAISFGKRLITTRWGGALEFCNDGNTLFIDYDFAFSSSHLNMKSSVWAEPKLDDLKQKMRLVVNQKAITKNIETKLGELDLIDNYSWSNIVNRHLDIITNFNKINLDLYPKIGIISTFFKRCGISTYTEHLITHMGLSCKVYADNKSFPFKNEFIDTELCWDEGSDDLLDLYNRIDSDKIDIVLIQFNYGFFNFKALNNLLDKLINIGVQVVIELHSTRDPISNPLKKLDYVAHNLKKCTRVIVHDISDLNRLKKLSVISNVVLIPHGLLSCPYSSKKYTDIKKIKIASFGFFLPNKGLIELIEAIDIVKETEENISLTMLNSEYPSATSIKLISEAKEIIRSRNLSKYINLDTEFHSDEDVLKKLSGCHIVAYPYQESNESASGAVRYGIASQSIVVVSPLEIFENVSPIVYKFGGFDPHSIANDILKIVKLIQSDSIEIKKRAEEQHLWTENFSFENIGYIYKNMLLSLYKNRAT